MKNANQPAFHGLTKREYIATKILQGLLSNSNDEIVYKTLDAVMKDAIIVTDDFLKKLDGK